MLTQLQFINLLLSKKDASLIINNGLTAEWFPQLKNEFNFIYNHFKNYNQIPDIETFLKAFPEFEVIEVSESIDYLLNELYREKNENFLVGSFNKMRELLVAGKTEEAMDYLNKASDKASANRQLEAIDILDDTSRYEAYLDKCNDFGKYYLSTGFKELDASFGGGIDRKNAYFVLSARAGIGKTLVMVKMATAAVERGLNVGMYEGEMTIDKIAGRFDTLMSHISNTAITKGGINVAVNYKNFLDDMKANHKGKFHILTRDSAGSDKVTVGTLRSFVEKYNLDVLFVDQLSLLDTTSHNLRSFEQAAEISKELKILQVQKQIPIIVASQQNRTSIEEGGFAGTQNLSLSDRIGQDATEVVFISKEENVMTFNIAKARDGAKKYKMSYLVDFDKGIFNYLPDEEDDMILNSSVNVVEDTEFSPMNINTIVDSDALPF